MVVFVGGFAGGSGGGLEQLIEKRGEMVNVRVRSGFR